jgi:hypothetical protein
MVACYVIYSRLFAERFDESEYGIDRDWPAEPNPGTVNEKPESDAQASADAEQAAAVLDHATAPADSNAPAPADANAAH